MRKATFFYLLRRGLLTGAGGFIKDGLVMASKFITQGLTHPAQGSAEFDGASDYIQLDTPFSYTNHTISAWVYVDNVGGGKFIFDARDANDDGIRMEITGDNYPKYSLNAADAEYTTAFSNEWIYMTASYDGTTQKLYVDGSLVVSSATSQSVSTTTDARIGASSYSLANYFNGNLANVAIWNRALSSDEINSVMWKGYDALEASEKNGLQAWYSLDDVASPSASLATMEALAVDKDATIENKAAITAAINALS